MSKTPEIYRHRKNQRAKLAFVTGEILKLEQEARAWNAEQARLKRPKRKKQPRHIRIDQPLKPLNPHKR